MMRTICKGNYYNSYPFVITRFVTFSFRTYPPIYTSRLIPRISFRLIKY